MFLIGSHAFNSSSPFNKGSDMLDKIVETLMSLNISFGIVTTNPPCDYKFNIPVYNLPFLHDEYSLSLFYSAIDVFVLTSRFESFSLSAQESLACGTPALGTNVGSMPEFTYSISLCFDFDIFQRFMIRFTLFMSIDLE